MSKFLNSKYINLESYTPGEQPKDQVYTKLNTNESPYPPAPTVIRAIDETLVRGLNLYPQLDFTSIKGKIAKLNGVDKENIFLSNGSDDILNFAFMAFGEKGAIFPEITYSFYSVYGDLHQVEYAKVSLRDDFTIDISNYLNASKFIVIANPNAPTGIALEPDEIRKILDTNKENVVLIDEAYVDFGAESCVKLIKEYDNLLVVQTFSKSRSMAGGRLGFAIGSKELIDDLEKIRFSTNPYNINRMTLAAADATLDENDYYMDNCKKIIETRDYTVSELEKLGFKVLPSKANFVFATSPQIGGEDLYLKLKSRGVLVRHFKTEKIKDYLRITIGTKDQMDILLSNTREILEETK